jgi:hypothetical protein
VTPLPNLLWATLLLLSVICTVALVEALCVTWISVSSLSASISNVPALPP